MKTVGWVYLLVFAVDMAVSGLSLVFPSLDTLSDVVSKPHMLGAIVIFVLGAAGVLRPRRVFVILAGYYEAMMGFGVVLTVYGLATRPEFLKEQEALGSSGAEMMSAIFPWFMQAVRVAWAIWLAVTVYGFVVYWRAFANPPAPASSPPEAA